MLFWLQHLENICINPPVRLRAAGYTYRVNSTRAERFSNGERMQTQENNILSTSIVCKYFCFACLDSREPTWQIQKGKA